MLYDMNTTRSLLSFVGMRDPYTEADDEPGPILALLLDQQLKNQPFDEIWLLCSGAAALERARDLEREARDETLVCKFHCLDFPVRDVIDYAEIWSVLTICLHQIQDQAGSLQRAWSVLLDSGTPQMKSTLFLAVRAGLFPAAVLQGIPPRFAGGVYKMRQVDLLSLPPLQLQIPDRVEEVSNESVILFQSMPDEAESTAPVSVIPGFIGRSPSFTRNVQKALAAARYDDPILILGETGTGKTMVARHIHEHSRRSNGPFVEVNCSAISESLAESELFGHVKGAYSGADRPRSGKFRAAHGGTLFLDEVGDLSLELQAKLLKAIEDRQVTPVGSDQVVPADARLLAATNRNLEELVAAGNFRRDLYERLKVVVINLPPLRTHTADIPDLANHFVALWNKMYSEKRFLDPAALKALQDYAWPGNVRELGNAIRSTACIAPGDRLELSFFPEAITACGNFQDQTLLPEIHVGLASETCLLPAEGINLRARLLQLEWDYVSAALRRCSNNREAAARLLGMTGHAFRKALRERLAVFMDESMIEADQ